MVLKTESKSGRICVLSDDLLGLILNYVTGKHDRRSFSEVCKQWLNVEGLNRKSLCVDKLEIPLRALTRFPNIVHLESWKFTTDTDLEFIAKTCPQIEAIKVTNYGCHFLGRKGFWALGKGCPKLSKVSLFGNKIGNSAVFALVNSANELKCLEFRCNSLISDPVLRAVGSHCHITSLEFTSCCNVTDRGLGFLAKGSVSKTLKRLVLRQMGGISDTGIEHLGKMCSLEQLELQDCGFSRDVRVTDVGGMAIAGIRTLRELKLCLNDISDTSVVAVAEKCCELEVLDISCCQVTGAGIRAFSSHPCLKRLVLLGLWEFDLSDVEILVLGCPSLETESVVVDSWFGRYPAWSFELMHDQTRKVIKFANLELEQCDHCRLS